GGLVAGAQILRAAQGGAGPLADLARQCWDLGEIERRYEEFLAEFAAPDCPDPLARLVELVHAWRRFPWVDPALPAELLPERWSAGPAGEQLEQKPGRRAARAAAAA